MNVPEKLCYLESHEWLRIEGETGVVGITDHAQAELTDIVFVELPPVGTRVEAGKPSAVVESVKAASDIYAPATGEVIEVNAALETDPGLVNRDPFGEGWLFKVSLGSGPDLSRLKTAAQYREQIS
jgi:glycine cleavage system H protein